MIQYVIIILNIWAQWQLLIYIIIYAITLRDNSKPGINLDKEGLKLYSYLSAVNHSDMEEKTKML